MALTGFIALVLLTQLTARTSGLEVALALGIFGLGAGLGLPVMTDTVMASVPEREAGVGSAVNDVSRQLGGALGVALIGSVVNHAYRSNLADDAPAHVPAGAVAAAGESIGILGHATEGLSEAAAAALTDSANTAFVDAITSGFVVSAAVMLVALIVALTTIPRRMRVTQAQVPDQVARDQVAHDQVDQQIAPATG
jgi:MFS transporter, DHA2 family, multidrug resistance protein